MSMTTNKAFYCSRWFLVVLLLVLVVPVALTGVSLMIPLLSSTSAIKPGISQENFHRIRPGMTQEEVEAILGKSTRPVEPDFIKQDGSFTIIWEHGYRRISLWFHPNKQVWNGTYDFTDNTDPNSKQHEFLVPLR